jgi:CheY-like chemotaxis protein
MPEGGVLRIATGNVTLDAPAAAGLGLAPGDYVGITVADSGAGIAPEAIGRVFEPFFTTKQPGRGSGLGLSMVRAMARQSGGQVHLSSTPGTGTVVRLHLPRASSQPDLPPAAGDEAIPSARPGETILLVEDDEPVRRTVAERLRRLGYTVIAASDAQAALKALRKPTRIDLLFSDIDMPGPTGVSLADHARRARPTLRILFTSAGGDTSGDDVVAPDRRFHHGYRLLLKPYRKQELARILRTTLDELL